MTWVGGMKWWGGMSSRGNVYIHIADSVFLAGIAEQQNIAKQLHKVKEMIQTAVFLLFSKELVT